MPIDTGILIDGEPFIISTPEECRERERSFLEDDLDSLLTDLEPGEVNEPDPYGEEGWRFMTDVIDPETMAYVLRLAPSIPEEFAQARFERMLQLFRDFAKRYADNGWEDPEWMQEIKELPALKGIEW